MTSDDQMEFELSVDSHIEVTSETVIKAMSIIILTGDKDKDYELLCKFLEPVLEYEYQIIREVINANCKNTKRWYGNC